MSDHIVSAVFDDLESAEVAILRLRDAGLNEERISLLRKDMEGTVVTTAIEERPSRGGMVDGMVGGGAIGLITGIAAVMIPGVGPFIAAGAIAATAVPGAAVLGTAIGATAGALFGMLTDHGVTREEARFYEERIHDGGVFVSVNVEEALVDAIFVREVLIESGGRNSAIVV